MNSKQTWENSQATMLTNGNEPEQQLWVGLREEDTEALKGGKITSGEKSGGNVGVGVTWGKDGGSVNVLVNWVKKIGQFEEL